MRFARFLVLLAGLLLLPNTVQAQVTWPADADWTALYRDGMPIGDVEGDTTGARDIVGDATNPAAFVFSDATNLYVRLRLDDDPTDNSGNLRPFTWGVEFETDGNLDDFESLVMVNGISNPEVISLQENTTQGTIGDPSDSAEVEIATYPFTMNGRVVGAASMFGGNADFFLDFAVPWVDLALVGVTPTSPFGLILGSGNSANSFSADIGTSIADEVSDPIACDDSGCAGAPLPMTLTDPADGAIIANDLPTVSGTTEPNASVAIVYNAGTADEQTATVTADGSGNFSHTPAAALPEGTNTVDATVTAGNRSGTDSVTFEVDLTAPTVTVDQPADGSATNTTTPTVSGTADPNSTVTLVFNAGTADEFTDTTTASSSGDWSYTLAAALPSGTNTVAATQTDAAGNTGSASATFTVDVDAPVVTIDQPADGSTVQTRRPTVSGSASELNTDVTLLFNAGTASERTETVMADATGDWVLMPAFDLPTGTNTLVVSQTDAAGNTGTATTTFEVDVGVAVAINAPGDGTATNDDTPDIVGTGTPGATVSVVINQGTPDEESADVTVDANGDWSYTTMNALPEGAHTADASQDYNGMVTTDAVTFEVDVTPPGVQINDPSDGSLTADSTPEIEGSTSEGNVTITIVIDAGTADERTATVEADANGNWSFTPATDLADGDHTINVTATDDAGNEGMDAVSFEIDSDQPFVSINSPRDESVTTDTQPTIAGRADAGVEVTITIDPGTPDEREVTVTADAMGNWTYTPDPLPDGKHKVRAAVTAMDGGVGMDEVDFEIDTTAPTVEINDPADGSIVNDATPKISGRTEAGATVEVTVGGTTYVTTADNTGVWEVEVDEELADGEHTVTARATDDAGIESDEESVTFSVDTVPPALTVTAPEDGAEVESTPTVTGTAEPGITVEVYVDGVLVGTTTTAADGDWSLDVPEENALGAGDHVIAAIAVDPAGNETSVEVNVTVGTGNDRDGDGLPDDVEAELGTDPDRADTDGDGLSDGEEVNTWNTDPLNDDTDADDVDDGEEIEHGTNPRAGDTDGDGLSDATEIFEWGTDPRAVDSDGGGVFDGVEVESGTSPIDGSDDYASDVLLSGGNDGCSTTRGAAGGGWLALLAIGLLAGRRRRRRKKNRIRGRVMLNP